MPVAVTPGLDAALQRARDGRWADAASLCERLLTTSTSPSLYWLRAFCEFAPAGPLQHGWSESLATALDLLDRGAIEPAVPALDAVASEMLGPDAHRTLRAVWECGLRPAPGAATPFEHVAAWRAIHRNGYFANHPQYRDRHHELGVGRVREALDLQPSDELLELGCGYGRLLHHLLPLVGRAVGVDPVAPLDETQRFLEGRGEVALVRTDGLTLWPVRSRTASKAVAFTVIQHLTRAGAALYFHELRRVLRPGGRLCVQFLTGGDPADQMRPDAREQSLSYTIAQASTVAERAGFVVQTITREELAHPVFDWLWLTATVPAASESPRSA
jgi:SAM-dependent methyltransferase